jgi:hypothetical protein
MSAAVKGFSSASTVNCCLQANALIDAREAVLFLGSERFVAYSAVIFQ